MSVLQKPMVAEIRQGDTLVVEVGPSPALWENLPFTSIAGTQVMVRTLDGRQLEPWKMNRVWVQDGAALYCSYVALPPGWKLVQEGCDEQVDR